MKQLTTILKIVHYQGWGISSIGVVCRKDSSRKFSTLLGSVKECMEQPSAISRCKWLDLLCSAMHSTENQSEDLLMKSEIAFPVL
jgi:hypothetical protein